ncbi:MAG: hypothetical protein ACXWQQ_02100 [Pseudobdellovibrio sp.]
MSVWTKNESFNPPQNILISAFSDQTANPLLYSENQSRQIKYLHKYLAGLHCKTIIVEPYYFDRDYLSEFSEFYSASARGYTNVCKRLHFFSEEVTQAEFADALSEVPEKSDKLKKSYLGFSVIRPLPHAPIGKTVIKWFDDLETSLRRIKASREYKVHIGGLELVVHGLAWQQQDSAVGACATVALWSAIHSAAFDENHYIPTTTEITKLAHKTASMGSRIFPTGGLTNSQLLEAIKELGLAPVISWGSRPNEAFSPERFAFLCSTYLRSGFPIILGGNHEGSEIPHAICLTGFREPSPPTGTGDQALLKSRDIKTIYIHDDNLGPNVRFNVNTETAGGMCSKYSFITIKAEAPPNGKYNGSDITDPTVSYPKFTPTRMRIALPSEIKISVDSLYARATDITEFLCSYYNDVITVADSSAKRIDFHYGIQFIKTTDYVGNLLKHTLSNSQPQILGKARLDILQTVAPMSLFLGVIRIWFNDEPLIDVLFDTSDIDSNIMPFAHVCFSPPITDLLTLIQQVEPSIDHKKYFGVKISAH